MNGFMRNVMAATGSAALAAAAAAQEDFTFCESGEGTSGAGATLTVSETEGGASFTITGDTDGEDYSIVGVYFDDSRSILGEAQIINRDGVEFDHGGQPDALPGGDQLTPPFETSVFFTAAPPGPHNGINPGEALELHFALNESFTFNDLLDQIASSELRIGLNANAGPDSGTLVIQRCRADFNCDSALDFFDFLAFQNAFHKEDMATDFNGDQTLDFFDFLTFINEFVACGGS